MSNYTKIKDNIHLLTIDNPATPNKKLEWINVVNASRQEIEYLRKTYGFDLNHLRASSAKAVAQRPILTNGDGYIFLILHFPIFVEDTIVPAEINFFISHGYLITIYNDNLPALKEFFQYCKKDTDSLLSYKFESSAILLYELIERMMLHSFNILDKNSIAIGEIENVIFSQKQKRAVSQILVLRRNIVNVRKIMQSHKDILKKLISMESSLVPEKNIRMYYSRLIDYSKTIWAILDNQKDMIEVLNSSNESLLNYRISDIMKTLTIFSVIVFPLTLLAAIFGMNTENGMPFTDTENGFWIIIAIMLAGSFAMLLYFKKKRWL